MKLNVRIPKIPAKQEKEPQAETASRMPDGTLRMDCRGCFRHPEPSSSECIRCISAALSRYGRSDRILLKSQNDIEISGPGAELLCCLSPMFPDVPGASGRCQNCECSPRALLAPIWNAFPETVFENTRAVLRQGSPKDDSCRACMQRSQMILDSAEAAYTRAACTAAAIEGGRA